MSKSAFYIQLNMKTPAGFESFGKFFASTNRKFAHALFSMLKGGENVSEDSILCLELMETSDGLPVNMVAISCTLEELAQNCRTITRETFKFMNLDEA